MRLSYLAVVILIQPACTQAADEAVDARRKQVNTVLDNWHKAAAEANEAKYFGYLAADAVFFGTDAAERWTQEEFRKYAKPFFDKGKAWSFKPTRRNVFLSKEGTVAWFDEMLDTPNLGPSRGTGVLVWDGSNWKIAQYHLCVPIPNDIFDKVKKMIEEAAKK
jgi:hypothetical protein